MSLPCAKALVETYPDEKRIAVIDPAHEELFRRSGLPFEIWCFKKSERQKLTQKLKKEQPELAILLTNSFGSYLAYNKARIKKRVGFGGKWTRMLLTHPADRSLLTLPQGERWVKLVDPELKQIQVAPLLKIQKDSQLKPHLLLFPGAKYGPSKQWSATAYANIVNRALVNNWKVSLIGTQEEMVIGHQIDKLVDGEVDMLFGTHNLKALLELIETFINPVTLANDSGAMHLMSACGVPTLGLYFSTSAENTPPAFGNYHVIESEIDCRPCYKRTCPFQHYDCREKISSDQVWQQLLRLCNS
jgi:heptosyltransferase-2